MREKKIYEACQRLLTVCSHCKEDENILIVTDEESMDMGMALWDAAERFPNRTLVLMNPRKMHGEEPTDLVAAAMLKADVIFRATTFSLSHSYARRRACEAGARDLNCCDYDFGMLEKAASTQTSRPTKNTWTRLPKVLQEETRYTSLLPWERTTTAASRGTRYSRSTG